MAVNNVLNISSSGIVKFDGAGAFSADTVTNHRVLVGGASNAITSLAAGNSGQVLQSAGASDPAFSTPTYPSASGTSRKILVSDGTNNVYSTETWATPGSSGNVLTSDGTNWTSAAASGGSFQTVSITLTNSQIKNLHGTPVEIIAAPGAGKGIALVTICSQLNYGGTNVFTASAAQTIGLYYNNNTTSAGTALSNTQIVANTNRKSILPNSSSLLSQAVGILDNVNIAAWNNNATEISGNAANNNTIDIIVAYLIVTF